MSFRSSASGESSSFCGALGTRAGTTLQPLYQLSRLNVFAIGCSQLQPESIGIRISAPLGPCRNIGRLDGFAERSAVFLGVGGAGFDDVLGQFFCFLSGAIEHTDTAGGDVHGFEAKNFAMADLNLKTEPVGAEKAA